MQPTAHVAEPNPRAALAVVLAGVCAALHVGKLAPAIGALQAALSLSLLQAGFLLSLVQLAGMGGGLLLGLAADRIGPRRSLIGGLSLLAVASAAGGAMQGVAPLLVLRALEGVGFLLVVLPAPGLVRRLSPPGRTAAMLGLWGAYMPLATALALLFGPLAVQHMGWRAWWWLLAALSLLMALGLRSALPPLQPAAASAGAGWWQALRQTLAAPGPWLVSLAFAAYSGQWLAVVGFLPTIYAQAGVAPAVNGVLTALVAAANIAGNLTGGRLVQHGWPPRRVLVLGFGAMAAASTLAFAWPGMAAPWPYLAVLAFSGMGGLIPATLFGQALRVAPGEHAVATTVGWMQQWSSAGQFAGPPIVAAIAAAHGSWQWTWLFTAGCCAAGVIAVWALAQARGGSAPQPAARRL